MMRLTIRLKKPLYDKVKKYADENYMSLSAVIIKSLVQFFKEQ